MENKNIEMNLEFTPKNCPWINPLQRQLHNETLAEYGARNINGVNVWTFRDTETAYNSTQCDDDMKNGDILLIPSENVVGICHTYPIAITTKAGLLHKLNIDVFDWVKEIEKDKTIYDDIFDNTIVIKGEQNGDYIRQAINLCLSSFTKTTIKKEV